MKLLKYNETCRLYDSDVLVLKDYKIKRKLTLHKAIRCKGFEIETKRRNRGTANNEKLENNIIRAKAKIFELSYCNSWDMFMTLTLDPKKYDRKNLQKYHRDLSQWIQNYNKKHGLNIKYLLIPEQHKDGAWHMHGLIMGLPKEHLITNKNGYLDWEEYKQKFGWCSIDNIKNHEAVSRYITKYISKDLADGIRAINAHMYYCSKGLQRAIEIKRGTMNGQFIIPWDYENDWIKCKWYDNSFSGNNYIIEH